jgi:lysophospholipase L1-like esterase
MASYRSTLAIKIVITLASIFIGLVLFEILAGFIIGKELSIDHERSLRYMLFGTASGAPAFRNEGKIFTYLPNSTVHSTAYYENGPALRKEYDYEFKTNNLGLVQKLDIEKDRPSILVLGDSFTEGQGATPWFYRLESGNSKPLQLINGGLLGTGFAQWKLLHDQLQSSGVRINKVAVPFISDDYQRTVWNFPERVLNCLGDMEKCKGDEGYYPNPKKDNEAFVIKLREFRDAEYAEKQASKERRFFRKYFPSLHFIWGYMKNEYKARFANRNLPAIEALAKQYKNNIVFIHIPTKEELEHGSTPNPLGQLAREKISGAGGKVIDGFKGCGLEPKDYFMNDPHPNPEGYKKIANCVEKAISELD